MQSQSLSRFKRRETKTPILFDKRINELMDLFNLPMDIKCSYSIRKTMHNMKVSVDGFPDLFF